MSDSEVKAAATIGLVAWLAAICLMAVVTASGCTLSVRHTEAGEEQSTVEFPPQCPGECK